MNRQRPGSEGTARVLDDSRVSIVAIGDDDFDELENDEPEGGRGDKRLASGYALGTVFFLLGLVLVFAEFVFPASMVFKVTAGLPEEIKTPWPAVVKNAGPPFVLAGLATLAWTLFQGAIMQFRDSQSIE